jgi:hypothetical protein
MLTRRQVLAGTAASSIAAIASARGVAAAAPVADGGFDAGFGTLQGGAAAVFHKEDLGFSFFVKLRSSAAQVFYKEESSGQISLFFKFFDKADKLGEAAFQKGSWMLVDQFGGFLKSPSDASAGFLKIDSSAAQIFIKYENTDQRLVEDVRTLSSGVLLPGQDTCQVRIE